MQKILSIQDPSAVETAHRIFQSKGVVVIPTDTVYGVSVLYNKMDAIEKIYQLKQRGKEKALPILIGSQDQLEFVTQFIPVPAQKLIDAFWPGALTLVLPKHPDLPPNLSDYATVGVRMPKHPFALQLMRKCGPLATTSANLSGGKNPTSLQEVLAQLSEGVDLYLDGGETAGDIPSTVVDCSSEEIKILREGLIPSHEIYTVLA